MAKQATAKNTATAWLIYSTASCSSEFCHWEEGPNRDFMVKKYSVIVNGGAGVMRKTGLITPLGTKTEITQEQMDFLNQNIGFQRMVNDGWLKAVKASGWQDDPDVVSADMNQRDGCAPYVPCDFKEGHEGKVFDKPVNRVTTRPRSNPMPIIQSAFR